MDAENYTREEIRKVSYFICSLLAEAIAFETAHATSLFILNSTFASRDKSGGNIFALITACNENECSPLKQKRENECITREQCQNTICCWTPFSIDLQPQNTWASEPPNPKLNCHLLHFINMIEHLNNSMPENDMQYCHYSNHQNPDAPATLILLGSDLQISTFKTSN